MTVIEWIVVAWVAIPFTILTVLVARDWWYGRASRKLENLYRLPSRSPLR